MSLSEQTTEIEQTGESIAAPRKSLFQTAVIALAAAMLAGVLYVGDTTMESIISALPALPLALPVLVVTAVLMFVGTPEQQRREWIARLKATASPKSWPMAVWALVCFIVWLLWMALSGLWAPDEAVVGPVVVSLVILAVIAAVSAVLFYLHPDALVWFWLAIVVFSVIFLYGGITGPRYVGRMTAFGGGPNVFARFMLYGAAAAVFFALWKKYLWAVLMFVAPFAYGLVASGSRGVMVATVVVVLFALVAVFIRWGWKWASAFYVGTAAALAIGYFQFIAGTKIEEYFKTRFIKLTFEKEHDSGRGLLHDEAFRIMGEHRFFGAGLHSFKILSHGPYPLEHPHNIFYTVGAEAGLVGNILLVVAVIALAVACRRSLRHLTAGLTFAVALAVLVAQLFSGYYYDSRPIWMLGFAAAFAILAVERRTELAVEPADEPVAEPITESDEADEIGESNEANDPEPVAQPEPASEPVTEPEPESIQEPEPTSAPRPAPKKSREGAGIAIAAGAAVGTVAAMVLGSKARRKAKLDERAEKWLRALSGE